ncbi:MAG: linear amide C-N hydrolase [Chthoniobacterales bacterium]|nr:linear amide C-N hydrolase [Chthoniobacterales bacterium]MCX7713774.1 linear amide C-N hydrolase [Chthoniobacterales bacterium]
MFVLLVPQEPFQIFGPGLPNGRAASGHLALADATGNSAIVEYLGGKPVIYRGREFTVMTNSPPFDQ